MRASERANGERQVGPQVRIPQSREQKSRKTEARPKAQVRVNMAANANANAGAGGCSCRSRRRTRGSGGRETRRESARGRSGPGQARARVCRPEEERSRACSWTKRPEKVKTNKSGWEPGRAAGSKAPYVLGARLCAWVSGIQAQPGRLSQVGSRWNRKVDEAWREIKHRMAGQCRQAGGGAVLRYRWTEMDKSGPGRAGWARGRCREAGRSGRAERQRQAGR